ncbi:hypothetical protein EXIGLDRAFT_778426 [Exidia glandulosa HHB12029]|uniref:Uncharacterized protein n=1 Tax=Exidia glandulosa HHB12029 TaxID=1314781 RepID=A0A165CJ34_EXIGL|nr:hypothetical protein EXIGLDRAFT_778426 [Exidia glandulosa HHB12029]
MSSAAAAPKTDRDLGKWARPEPPTPPPPPPAAAAPPPKPAAASQPRNPDLIPWTRGVARPPPPAPGAGPSSAGRPPSAFNAAAGPSYMQRPPTQPQTGKCGPDLCPTTSYATSSATS